MTAKFLDWLRELILSGDVHPFYVTPEWRGLSRYVLSTLDRNECQLCKHKGRYRRADLVHHVKHVKEHPALALDIWFADTDGRKHRNLISVCKQCHETECHPERMRTLSSSSGFRNDERWD